MSGVLSVRLLSPFLHLYRRAYHCRQWQNDAYKNTFGNPSSNAQGAIVASMPAGSLVGALIVNP